MAENLFEAVAQAWRFSAMMTGTPMRAGTATIDATFQGQLRAIFSDAIHDVDNVKL